MYNIDIIQGIQEVEDLSFTYGDDVDKNYFVVDFFMYVGG